MKKVDFFSREEHHIKHGMALYEKMPEKYKGQFFHCEGELAQSKNDIVVVFSYGDLRRADTVGKKIIFMEHGVGMYYNVEHPSYAGSTQHRGNVILRLSPNELHARKERDTLSCPVKVVGVPKMDKWASFRENVRIRRRKPVVAVSFHWDCHVCPETRSAYSYFMRGIDILKMHYNVIGHGHPRIIDRLEKMYKTRGIPVYRDFDDIMKKADVYMCDNSSTIFEFAFIKKPVVFLNSPYYRKNIHHEGNPRFWKYANMGPQANKPDDLVSAVYWALFLYNKNILRMEEATQEIFTFTDGRAGERAVEAIIEALHEYENKRISNGSSEQATILSALS
jgi:hypothetical protein